MLSLALAPRGAASFASRQELVVDARALAVDLLRGRTEPAQDRLGERQRHFGFTGLDDVRSGLFESDQLADVCRPR